jgi:prevent-host-death family protein
VAASSTLAVAGTNCIMLIALSTLQKGDITMAETTISAFEARRKFGKVLDTVAANGNSVIVERHGEPVAVVISIAE